MLLGCYYLTYLNEEERPKKELVYSNSDQVMQAYEAGVIGLRTPIKVRINGEIFETTHGRIMFNQIIPKEIGFQNETMKKNNLKKLLRICFYDLGMEITALLADQIKDLGYTYATKSGLSISKDDMITPDNKDILIDEVNDKVRNIQNYYWNGFMTESEKYAQSINVWAGVKKVIEKEMKYGFLPNNHIFNFVDSGARGNW